MINGNTFYFDFEVKLMEFLQRTLGENVINFISKFSALGEETIIILIIGLLFWCIDKKYGVYVGTNVVVGLVINPLLKNIFWRRRPYFDNENINCYRPVESDADIYDIRAQGFSFPSGHSTNSVVVYGSLTRYSKNKVLKIIAFAFPLLVGLSRVTVGVHYPTDVLCGWLLGLFVIFFIPFIMNRFGEEKSHLARLCIFLFSCIGIFYCKTSDYYTGLGIMGGLFLAVEIEKRFIKFDLPEKKIFWLTRIIGGFAVYGIMNALLKAAAGQIFADPSEFLEGIIRIFRYAIVSFISIGLYPAAFRLEKKI